jgi:hypothetical protein
MQSLRVVRRAGLNGRRRFAPWRGITSAAYSTPEQYAADVLSDRSPSIASVETEADVLSLKWADGHRSRFHYVWLRDHCPSTFDEDTKQRRASNVHIPRSITPAHVKLVSRRDASNQLIVEWADADRTTSVFSAQWLRRACYSDKRRSERLLSADATRTAWEGNSFKPPSVSFADVMVECHSNGSGGGGVDRMWEAMRELWRYGLLLIQDVPENYASLPAGVEPSGVPYQDATEAFANRVGFVRRTLYGDMWSFGTFEGTDTGNDSAYSNVALDLHTDGAYMRDPPALQLFTCMFTSGDGGGLSRYADGLKVAERLREADPSAYDFFRTTPLAYHCQDEGSSLMASGPVFEGGSEDSQFDRFRYNDYDRLTLSHLPPQDVERFYEYRTYCSDFYDTRSQMSMVLLPLRLICAFGCRSRAVGNRD